MSALIYLLVAGMSGYLGVKAYREDPTERVRKDFFLLASLLSLAYISFSLHLAPGIPYTYILFGAFSAFLPIATLRFLDHFFPLESFDNQRLIRRLWVITPIVTLLCLTAELVLIRENSEQHWPLKLLGTLIYSAFGLVLYRLWQMHQASNRPLERSRIRYLLILISMAVIPSIFEELARAGQGTVDLAQLNFNARSWALQGGLPPISTLCAAILIYSLSQVLTLERLLDLHEIIAKIATVAASGLLLVGIQAILVFWLGETKTPVHQGYQLFLVGVLFIFAYEPFRAWVQPTIARSLNRSGHQLTLAMVELDRALPRVISRDDLARRITTQFNRSGRFGSVALYVHDTDRQNMQLLDYRTAGDKLPLRSVAMIPFVEGFIRGIPVYIRQDLSKMRGASKSAETAAARLRTMDAMNCDIVAPMMSGDLVLGWIAIREATDIEGLSQDEISRLCQLMAQAAVILENLHDFETIKEQHRLAALGTMSAGLAHEIRNPLAGIKGAAQFLQTIDSPDPAGEFLEVIISEVNRLNEVVQNFLTYARPFEISPEPTEINAIVCHVLALVRAEEGNEDLVIVEELGGGLPMCPTDATMINQVIINLVRNAVQAVAMGVGVDHQQGVKVPEGLIKITTRRSRMQGQLVRGKPAIEISVTDNGPGIAKEDIDKLFIPFFTTKSGGTGLGLPICQRIIRAHEGEMEVSARLGSGARFTIRLPETNSFSPTSKQTNGRIDRI